MGTITAEEAIQQSKRRHRRDVLLFIALPMLGGMLIITLVMAVVLLLPKAIQVSMVADVTLLLFILCPLALCTLPFSIGLGVLAVISGRLHPLAARPLRKGEALTLTMSQRVAQYSDRVARLSIRFNAWFAPLAEWMDRAFGVAPAQPTPPQEEKHEQRTGTTDGN